MLRSSKATFPKTTCISSYLYLPISRYLNFSSGSRERPPASCWAKRLAKQFWGRHLWSRGYFVASSGNVTDEVIAQYIEMQDKMEQARADDFSISDDA